MSHQTVLSQHGWISRVKLAWFGMLHLGTIPVYIRKVSRPCCAMPNCTMPCPAASVNALLVCYLYVLYVLHLMYLSELLPTILCSSKYQYNLLTVPLILVISPWQPRPIYHGNSYNVVRIGLQWSLKPSFCNHEKVYGQLSLNNCWIPNHNILNNNKCSDNWSPRPTVYSHHSDMAFNVHIYQKLTHQLIHKTLIYKHNNTVN